jgi:hypothetical protein
MREIPYYWIIHVSIETLFLFHCLLYLINNGSSEGDFDDIQNDTIEINCWEEFK